MTHTLRELESRYNRLKENGKNVDSPGVLHKIQRKIRNIKAAGKHQQDYFTWGAQFNGKTPD